MGQALFADAASWAEDNFAAVDLGLDSRRDRLVYSAARLATSPGASLPAVFRPNDLRCFYSLLHRKEATHQALLAGHTALTKQAMTTTDVILVIHDTTELDFTSHKALHPHLGPVGTGRGRGLLQHNSLAVRASDGLLLGLAHQQLRTRRPRPQGETRARRRHRDRESALWADGFRGVGAAPPGACWVDVCDRGADLFEALAESVRLGHHALIRACQDRCVAVEQHGLRQPTYLMQLARSLEGQAEDVVEVRQKGGRPARQAKVQLAACPAWVEPPKPSPKRRGYREVAVWVIRVWEESPPAGVEALEWVLLSTLPARTEQELLTRRDWYAWRWPIAEDYHQAEKTGCGEERVRFQDGHSLRAALAILAVVAVRLVQLRQAARACPHEAASAVATPGEIALVQQALGVAAVAWTVAQFVGGVARLGGFLGRKCDGEPGWKTLWRGQQKLQAMLEGARLAEQLRHGQAPAALPESITGGDPQYPP
jgi:Transposase Tn5 dimerisation domain